jgi:hypothetical protein
VTALRLGWTRLVLAGALPVAVAAAWIPFRDQVPNTDLALTLVLVIATVGWFAGPMGSLVSAIAAAGAFDVLDTRPYGALTMSRGDDITTALILLTTGLLVGVGSARLARYRKSQRDRSDALAVVMEASGLVATGEERQLITEALSAELVAALQLVACEFHAEPPSGTRPSVARDGNLVGLLSPANDAEPFRIDLPVWCQGEVVAHYRLTLGLKRPTQQELRVALSLADQAGAAMANPHLDPPPQPAQPGRLRLLPPTREGGAAARTDEPEVTGPSPGAPEPRKGASNQFDWSVRPLGTDDHLESGDRDGLTRC